VYATRVLGFVNAPALMQRVVAELTASRVDVGIYERRRDVFKSVLDDAGIEYAEPEGAFYLFCKVPPKEGKEGHADDVAFVMTLKDHLVLAVPGSGFGGPGWFRLAYCVDEKVIEASREAFKAAAAAWKK
jgi:aspartate aminotransferase